MYLSAHLDPKPHQKASPGQQVAGPRCLKGNMGGMMYCICKLIKTYLYTVLRAAESQQQRHTEEMFFAIPFTADILSLAHCTTQAL